MEKNIYITPDIQIDVLNVELLDDTLSIKNAETNYQFAPKNNGLWEEEDGNDGVNPIWD